MLTIFSAIRRLWESNYQNAEQKADMERVFKGVKGAGVLDYVTAWYLKAVHYMKGDEQISRFARQSAGHAETATRTSEDRLRFNKLHHTRRAGRRFLVRAIANGRKNTFCPSHISME